MEEQKRNFELSKDVVLPVIYKATEKFGLFFGGWRRHHTNTETGEREERIVGTYTGDTPVLVENGDQFWVFTTNAENKNSKSPTHYFKLKKRKEQDN